MCCVCCITIQHTHTQTHTHHIICILYSNIYCESHMKNLILYHWTLARLLCDISFKKKMVYSDYKVMNSYIFMCTCWFYTHRNVIYFTQNMLFKIFLKIYISPIQYNKILFKNFYKVASFTLFTLLTYNYICSFLRPLFLKTLSI